MEQSSIIVENNNAAESVQNTNRDKVIISLVINFLTFFVCDLIARRIVCVILIAVHVSWQRISELTGFSQRTIYTIERSLDSDNTQTFLIGNGRGRKSKLDGIEQDIIVELNNNNYRTQQQIVDMIKKNFGIKTSKTAVGRFLKNHDLKRRKTGSFPAKADPVAQQAFYKSTMQPLMEQAKEGKVALLFMDASHFVLGDNYLGYIYGTVRRFVQSFSGRKRYNILGALDYVTKKITTITNDSYISSVQVCELLKRIAVEYAGIPVYIILDNAKYQRCKLVQNLATDLGINLMFLPTYSPNLNLFERVWKYVKGKLRTQYYDQFPVFCNTIDSILESAYLDDKESLDRLINEKVQLFTDLILISGSTFASKESC
jgi:transposase